MTAVSAVVPIGPGGVVGLTIATRHTGSEVWRLERRVLRNLAAVRRAIPYAMVVVASDADSLEVGEWLRSAAFSVAVCPDGRESLAERLRAALDPGGAYQLPPGELDADDLRALALTLAWSPTTGRPVPIPTQRRRSPRADPSYNPATAEALDPLY